LFLLHADFASFEIGPYDCNSRILDVAATRGIIDI
jgi:hypothetical protein